MPEWETVRLGDLVDITHGYAFKGEYFSDEGPGWLVMTPGNFARCGGFQRRKPKYYIGPIPEEYILAEGDLTVTMTDLSKTGDTLGYPALIPVGATYLHNQRIGRVLVLDDKKLDKRYLSYALRQDDYRAHVLAGATGSTVRHTSPSRICDYRLILPPFPEQRAIAAVLGALDDKIALNEQIAAKSRELAIAHFSRALMSGAEYVRLSTLTEVLVRGVAAKYVENDGVAILNQRCIRDGRVSAESARLTLADKVTSSKMLQPDDVLVNSTGVGTLGRVARWTSAVQATVDSHVTIVRFARDVIDPLVGGFAMLLAEPRIADMGEGSTGQTELSRLKLGELEILLPDDKTMAKSLRSLERLADRALLENRALAELRDTLLPRLMSGELRIKDAERQVVDAV